MEAVREFTISVVIPALNEQHHIFNTIQSTGLSSSHTRGPLEVIVVDGGSTDSTIQTATKCGAKVLCSAKGRGIQLITGASAAKGDVMLFLHADSKLPKGYIDSIQTELSQPRHGRKRLVWGCFQNMAIQKFGWGMRVLEFCIALRTKWLSMPCIALRTKWLSMPYGDQAIFVLASTYKELGGFKDWPLLEDYEMVMRLRRLTPPALVKDPIVVNGRRWQKLGIVATTLMNQFILSAFHLGVPPKKLAEWYYKPTGVLGWLLRRLSKQD
eukprot:CAMPEP_0114289774 /NCGR_PEP_ID=MMETSP0059-20121206/7561_1 /TAXON_ID=36894 /ORGANISM="Pyramimonas parkeae, Strain CCMP726" /LENGTH=268 /DNA_ID=CAMNT_0001411085 /DNA_START=332 /DNA_END=1138 /DNA_ORIENTATION=-